MATTKVAARDLRRTNRSAILRMHYFGKATNRLDLGLVGATFPGLFSIFFVALEVASTVFIVWYAWTWPRPDGAMPTSA
jgi:hypothetical protein